MDEQQMVRLTLQSHSCVQLGSTHAVWSMLFFVLALTTTTDADGQPALALHPP
jgi:hypothetical protein